MNTESYFELIIKSGYTMAAVKSLPKDKAICVSYKVQEMVDGNKSFLEGIRAVELAEVFQLVK